MMATLRCDHPDIEAFVDAKRDPRRLRMFNVSVLVTDAFMKAVKETPTGPRVRRQGLPHAEGARAVGAHHARDLRLCRAGVIFIDRVNRRNNLHYCETIQATNPCVTAETWVHTAEGPRQVADLIGRSFTAKVDGRELPATKPVSSRPARSRSCASAPKRGTACALPPTIGF